MSENKLALITKEDLSLANDNSLNEKQLTHLLRKTPPNHVRERPAKGGGIWQYVSGGYVKKVLNLMFGWDWDFEIVSHSIEHGEVVVLGKLTCRSAGKQIVKTQFGNKEIVYTKADPSKPLSIGNDLKAAATDALKKCASEIGIAADIYNKDEFREVNVSTEDDVYYQLQKLFREKKKQLVADLPEVYENINRIVTDRETASYKKAIKQLQQI